MAFRKVDGKENGEQYSQNGPLERSAYRLEESPAIRKNTSLSSQEDYQMLLACLDEFEVEYIAIGENFKSMAD